MDEQAPDIRPAIEALMKAEEFSFDLETTGFNPHQDVIKGVSFSVGEEPGQTWWLPFRGAGAVSQVEFFREAAPALSDPTKTLCGCLTGWTRVRLADGTTKSISEIVNKRLPVEVLSYNFETGKVEPRRIVNWFKGGCPTPHHSKKSDRTEEWLAVRTEHKDSAILYLTPNHRVFTVRGKIPAGDLVEGDRLFLNEPRLTESQFQLIIGSGLGDGGVYSDVASKNAYFSCAHSDRQSEYLELKRSFLWNHIDSSVCWGSNERGYNRRKGAQIGRFCTRSSIQFKEIQGLLYSGKRKVLGKELISRLGPFGLACWFMDDGCNDGGERRDYFSICTYGFSRKEVVRCAALLRERFGVPFKVGYKKNRGRGGWILRVTGAGARAFASIVAPFIPPSLSYKLPPRFRGQFVGWPAVDPTEVTPVRVVSVEKVTKFPKSFQKTRYDIEVEGSHNYFAGNLLVSNSNLKFDLKFLKMNGVEVKNKIADTMVADWMLDENVKRHGLKEVVEREFNYKMMKYEEAAATEGNIFPGLDRFAEYARDDAKWVLKLWKTLKPRLEAQGLIKLFETVEMEVVRVLVDLELKGVRIDIPFLKDLKDKLWKEMEESSEAAYKLASHRFQIDSSQKVSYLLFEELKLPIKPGIERGKSGFYSTDDDILKKYSDVPIVGEIMKYRYASHTLNTFVNPYLEKTRHEDRIHPDFGQAGTIAGRFVCKKPNLQQIPAKVKKMFIASEGCSLICGDFNQLQFRLVGHFAMRRLGWSRVAEAYAKGKDLHEKTRVELRLPDRKRAKLVNFAFIFGRGFKAFSEEEGVPMGEAKKYYYGFHGSYPDIRQMADVCRAEICKQGFVSSLAMRRRRFPMAVGADPNDKAVWWDGWVAWNSVIQASESDLVRIVMRNIRREVLKRRESGPLWERVHMLVQVHDELVMEAPDEIAEEVKTLMATKAESALKLEVGITMEIGIAKNWGSAKESK